jgi:hypothetical protein
VIALHGALLQGPRPTRLATRRLDP